MKANLRWLALLLASITVAGGYGVVVAQTPPPGPQDGGTVGVEGTIPSPPPSQAATIATPGNGQVFTNIPVTVSGLCPADTLVKIFSNEIFVGSAVCTNGSYSVQISLFSGRNDLVARVFDNLDQQGPDSAVTSVTFNDAQFAQFGSYVLITSQYARRAADPDSVLEWPVVISSGVGPYALSVDWGDGTPPELRSEPFAGTVTVRHTYKASGVYRVTFKVVDRNGTAGFLQVVAVARGPVSGATAGGSGAGQNDKTVVVESRVAWWPFAASIVLIIAGFWLGQRSAITRLRHQLEREYR